MADSLRIAGALNLMFTVTATGNIAALPIRLLTKKVIQRLTTFRMYFEKGCCSFRLGLLLAKAEPQTEQNMNFGF